MRRVAWVLLLLFAFVIPWEYSLDLGAPLGNIARVTGILLLLTIVPAVLQAGRMRAPGALQWLVLGLFLWFVCTYFWTIDKAATLERLRTYMQVMITVGLVWELSEHADDLRSLMRAYVAGSWVLAALTLANFASPATAGQARFVAEGQDPNDVARFLDLALPMAALLLADRRWWQKALALGYLPLGLMAVLLTASRSGLLAAFVAIGGCVLLLLRSHRRLLVGAVLALPVWACAFWLVIPRATLSRIATIPEQLARGDLNQRLNIWMAGSRAFAHAPLLGWGAGSFVTAAKLAPIDTAHNTALSLAVDGGLVALALGLAIVVVAWRSTLRMRGALQIALGAALLVWMVTSLVATVEWSRSTWLLFALIAVAGRQSMEEAEAVAARCTRSAPEILPVAHPEPSS